MIAQHTGVREAWEKAGRPAVVTDGRPVKDVARDLNEALERMGMRPEETGMSDQTWHDKNGARKWPTRWKWIACFAVTGTAEGHYVHVEIVRGDPRGLVLLGKTFEGMGRAYEVAEACALVLGA